MNLTDKITITCEDNMALMARYPDKYFDLAIVDPPYGIGQNFNHRFDKVYENIAPNKEYFKELFRVSKNQIIWGGNYFTDNLNVSKSWICWDKLQSAPKFSDFELAWTSFDIVANIFKYCNNGGFVAIGINKKIHPTQKPIALYKWILDKYAKQGHKILDTHLGSGSIAIACHDYGFELTACELYKEYYDASVKRIKNHISQQKLF